MLTCNNLSLNRGNKNIFSNLGFSLQNGACLIVKGSNGSGKTSLLKTIATILKPQKGEIFFNEINIESALDEYCYLTEYIGHEEALDEGLTVSENLNFWAEIYNTGLIITAAIRTFALEEVADLPVKKISKGMKRKVILSKLLLSHAKIWLLDEPLVNLDSLGIETLHNIISAKCSQGGIVIISTNQETKLKTPLTLEIEDYKYESNSSSDEA